MNNPKISVIIPVKNQESKIENCLKAVFAQTLAPFEVIVVDGHSTDNTIEIAKRFPIVVLFENYHNRSGACKVGIESATGDYIAFTDGDCIPDKNWLLNLYIEVRDDVAGIGGKYVDIGNNIWSKAINLTFETPISGAKSRWNNKRIVKQLSVCGANGMCRKKDILAVGSFSGQLTGAEDLEASYRLSKLGQLVYTPDAIVVHDHGRGLKDFAKQSFRYGGWRRESRLIDIQLIPIFLIPILILLSIFTFIPLAVAVAVYILMVTFFGIYYAFKNKEIKYLVAIPIAFIVQHTSYIAGYWKETIYPKNRLKFKNV